MQEADLQNCVELYYTVYAEIYKGIYNYIYQNLNELICKQQTYKIVYIILHWICTAETQ